MEDTANKPLYHTTGKNDAASQQIIAALAMDLADRRKSEVKPDALDCTTTVGGPWASIVLTHSDTAKTKYTIDLCLFKGDERTAALVDQIKALIPDLDSIVASHHK